MDVLARIQERARLHGPNETRRAVGAILASLADILPRHVFHQLTATFPDDLHPTGPLPPVAVAPGRNAFVSRLAAHLLIDEPDAAFLARVIFEQWNAAARTLSPATIAYLAPAGLRPLLRAQISPTQILTAQILTAQIPTAQIPTAQIPTAQIPTAQIPTAQISTTQIPTAQIPTAQISTAQISTAEAVAGLGSSAPAGLEARESHAAGIEMAGLAAAGLHLGPATPEPRGLDADGRRGGEFEPAGNELVSVVPAAADPIDMQREVAEAQAGEAEQGPAWRPNGAPRRIVRVATNAAAGHHQRTAARQLSA
ncbi:DUF2267 domain-containing protein [Winogradskya consettensis]|nr:DUF2267 domain-containing protein [Actinoplanes consettensis]